jgi:hypothetical protein
VREVAGVEKGVYFVVGEEVFLVAVMLSMLRFGGLMGWYLRWRS